MPGQGSHQRLFWRGTAVTRPPVSGCGWQGCCALVARSSDAATLVRLKPRRALRGAGDHLFTITRFTGSAPAGNHAGRGCFLPGARARDRGGVRSVATVVDGYDNLGLDEVKFAPVEAGGEPAAAAHAS